MERSIGLLCAHWNTNFGEPLREHTEDEKEAMKLSYYDKDTHRSEFVLPRKGKKVTIEFCCFLFLFVFVFIFFCFFV